MPGFIGVRYTEMQTIEPDNKYIDIYYTFGGPEVGVVFADETFEARTNPAADVLVHRLWSYQDVNNIRAYTEVSIGPAKIYTSQNGGTGWISQVVPVEIVAELSADKLYGITVGGSISLSVTGGATWFDHIAVPGGRSGFGDIKVTQTHLYAETRPAE